MRNIFVIEDANIAGVFAKDVNTLNKPTYIDIHKIESIEPESDKGKTILRMISGNFYSIDLSSEKEAELLQRFYGELEQLPVPAFDSTSAISHLRKSAGEEITDEDIKAIDRFIRGPRSI